MWNGEVKKKWLVKKNETWEIWTELLLRNGRGSAYHC